MCALQRSLALCMQLLHTCTVFTHARVLNACCLLLYVEMLFVCKLTSATYVLGAVSHLYVGATNVHCSVVCSVHALV